MDLENKANISVQELTFGYDASNPILNQLTLNVASGEIVALVGPSGCGKSTLLRSIAGLVQPISGTISLGLHPHRRAGDLSYVFQDPTLLPWRTVEENVRLPMELGRTQHSTASETRVSSKDAAATTPLIHNLLRSVGLEPDTFAKFPRELSGGMRMRTSLARALVTDPLILLLDEPFAALDDLLRTRMNELVIELWNAKRRTIVFVTHNIAEAVFLSHRIAVFGKGKIASTIDNDLPWPRSSEQRSTVPFAQRYAEVSTALARSAGEAQ